jgi:acyl carrier protein
MNEDLDDLVLDVVAHHLCVNRDHVSLSQRVHEDLDLDPLDLVLIALRLEDIEQVEFPVAALEDVERVADLVTVMRILRELRPQMPSWTRALDHDRQRRERPQSHARLPAGVRVRRQA